MIKSTDGTHDISVFVYFWMSIFILPIPLMFLLHTNLGIRNFNYFWALISVTWLWFNRKLIIQNKISIKQQTIIHFLWITLFSFCFSLSSKFLGYHLHAYDFGIFQNMIDNIINKNIGYSSVVGFYHFSTHQNYILFLIVPFYYIFHSALTLQIIAATTIWLTLLVIYFIAKEYKLNTFIIFMITLSYSISPLNGLDNDFMPETFMPLFYAAMFLFYKRKQYLLAAIFFGLSLLTKEDAILYTVGFGALSIYDKKYTFAAFIIACSLIFGYINLEIVQPYFVAKSNMINPTTIAYWSQWGQSKHEIAMNMIHNPDKVFYSIFNTTSGIYRLYLPFLFLTIIIPEVIFPSILTILMAATCNALAFHGYKNYYGMTLNLINYIGIIIIFSHLNENLNKLKKLLFYFMTLMLFIFPLISGGYQPFYYFNLDYIKSIHRLVNIVENNYKNNKLCLQDNLSPILRPYDFIIPPEKCCNNEFLFNSKSCTIVLTTYGKPAPSWLKPDSPELKYLKCKRYEGFLFCDRSVTVK